RKGLRVLPMREFRGNPVDPEWGDRAYSGDKECTVFQRHRRWSDRSGAHRPGLDWFCGLKVSSKRIWTIWSGARRIHLCGEERASRPAASLMHTLEAPMRLLLLSRRLLTLLCAAALVGGAAGPAEAQDLNWAERMF